MRRFTKIPGKREWYSSLIKHFLNELHNINSKVQFASNYASRVIATILKYGESIM